MELKDAPATIFLHKPYKIRGLVATFDVLGYKNFCKGNPSQKLIEEVLPYIDLAPEGMVGLLCQTLARNQGSEAIRKFAERLVWRVFSDTIIVAIPDSEKPDPSSVTLFLIAVAAFNRLLFKDGWPTRGAIQYGEFFVANRCAAGQIIVDAMDQIQNLGAACIVIDDSAAKIIRNRCANADPIIEMLTPAKVWCKDGLRNLIALNWLMLNFGNEQNPVDLDKYVASCFTANGKTLDATASRKIAHTVRLFEYFLARPEQRFATERRYQRSCWLEAIICGARASLCRRILQSGS